MVAMSDALLGEAARAVASRVARLRGELEKIIQVARAASFDGEDGTASGERWRRVCRRCDVPIAVDPVVDSEVECREPGCCGGVSLRSVQVYGTVPGWRGLPHFIVSTDDTVRAAVGLHMATHDPAHEIAVAEALLAVLDLHKMDVSYRCVSCATAGWSNTWEADRWPCLTLSTLLPLGGEA
jgi:hypothetical protein